MSTLVASLAFVAALNGPAAKSVNAFYIGHSLISDIPDMVQRLAQAAGHTFTFKEQFIPGSPLSFQWTEPTRRKSTQDQFRGFYDQEITRATEVLVMTDSVPRGSQWHINESKEFVGKFVNFARKKNPQMEIWYYEGWPCIKSGTDQGCEWENGIPNRNLKWIPRLAADRKMWQDIAKSGGAGFLPGGSGFELLGKEIEAGRVPGIRTVADLFGDDIHPLPVGKYFIACIQFAVLFGETPVGLPHRLTDRWGRKYYGDKDWTGKVYSAPSDATARKLQEVAWQAAKLAIRH